MTASLYLVLVNVRYSKDGEKTHRQWPVRIVAPDPDSANLGAMNWAQLQEPRDVDPTAERFANCVENMGAISTVDCIGESLLDASLRYYRSANPVKSQPANEAKRSAETK